MKSETITISNPMARDYEVTSYTFDEGEAQAALESLQKERLVGSLEPHTSMGGVIKEAPRPEGGTNESLRP